MCTRVDTFFGAFRTEIYVIDTQLDKKNYDKGADSPWAISFKLIYFKFITNRTKSFTFARYVSHKKIQTVRPLFALGNWIENLWISL